MDISGPDSSLLSDNPKAEQSNNKKSKKNRLMIDEEEEHGQIKDDESNASSFKSSELSSSNRSVNRDSKILEEQIRQEAAAKAMQKDKLDMQKRIMDSILSDDEDEQD